MSTKNDCRFEDARKLHDPQRDKKHKQDILLTERDQVWVTTQTSGSISRKTSTKMGPKRDDPYAVKKQISPVSFEITAPDFVGHQLVYITLVHYSLIMVHIIKNLLELFEKEVDLRKQRRNHQIFVILPWVDSRPRGPTLLNTVRY